MKAIILAAGIGKRLQKVAGDIPKSMIQIGVKSIIHHQLESCKKVGITKFVIVLGYEKNILKAHILEKINPANVTFIVNPIYDKTNTLYSLWLCRDLFTEDFIYFNADVIFGKNLLEKISDKSEYSQLLLETKSCAEEEVKMIINKNNRILEIGKQLEIERCAGEFIGIGKFNKNILSEFKKFLQYGIDNKQENNYFEYAVNLLAKKVVLKAVPTDDIPCIEIDFPQDLERAKQLFSK